VIDPPGHFEIKLLPIPDAEDPSENKVSIKMEVKLPQNYPAAIPEIHLRADKGVSSKNCTMLETKVREESEKLIGDQMIFMLTNIVKEWLDEHNDDSDQKDDSKKLNQFVESSFDKDGTPVTVETFNLWWTEFREELEKNKTKISADRSILTGKEFFARSGSTALVDSSEPTDKGTEIDWELFTEETEFADIPASDEEEDADLFIEEQMARLWHEDMTWRKVLVSLEGEAHTHVIVRRKWVNAAGWQVIDHLLNNHEF